MSKKSKVKHMGKKGGVGVLTPEMVGAMAGAAIGGVAGMMLGNRHNKAKLATLKHEASSTAQDVENEAKKLVTKTSGKVNSYKKKAKS